MNLNKSSRVFNKSENKNIKQDIKIKLNNQAILNKKLLQLFDSVKNNAHAKKLQHSQNNSMLINPQKVKLKKQNQSLKVQVAHMMTKLNSLLSQNKKLKEQVNTRRKQRVIYSNIFKKFQKDIQDWEHTYQSTLLQSLVIEDSSKKVIEKLSMMKRKLIKQIKGFQKHNSTENDGNNNQQKKDQQKLLSNKFEIQNQLQQKYSKKDQQKQKKNKNIQKDYQQQAKSILYQNLLSRLIKMTNLKDLKDIKIFLDQLDDKIQEAFDNYSFLQNQNQNLSDQIKKQNAYFQVKQKQIQSSSNLTELRQLIKGQQKIVQTQTELKNIAFQCQTLQKTILQKTDLNCHNLSNQQIIQYIKHNVNKKSI